MRERLAHSDSISRLSGRAASEASRLKQSVKSWSTHHPYRSWPQQERLQLQVWPQSVPHWLPGSAPGAQPVWLAWPLLMPLSA